MPAEIPNAQMLFVNGTRGFQSLVAYQCDPGYVPVGRTTLMCDVDERWNGPPPRCDPVFCDEPIPFAMAHLVFLQTVQLWEPL